MVDKNVLSGYRVFQGLNERELEQLAGIARSEQHESGVRIFQEKSLATRLYIVESGQVEIKMRYGGDRVAIDEVGPGQVFGWSAVAEPHSFTAGAWTSADTKLISFDAERLRELFEANTHIGYRMVKAVAGTVARRLNARDAQLLRSMEKKGAAKG